MNCSIYYIKSIDDSIISRHPNISPEEMIALLKSKKDKIMNITFNQLPQGVACIL